MNATHDVAGWTHVSRVYEKIQRLTLPLAERLVTHVHSIHPLTTRGAHAFDNGCDTGILTTALKTLSPNLRIFASDASSGMVSLQDEKIAENGWKEVETRTLDARRLEGVDDGRFSHSLSTFMICLAPGSDDIAREMYRVTRRGGIVGLAVYSDPYFGVFNTPWTQACQSLIPEYESVLLMSEKWTRAAAVKAGLEEVGFRDVNVSEERQMWKWESVQELNEYFFEGGNPGNVLMVEPFLKMGGDMGEARRRFDGLVGEMYGVKGGRVQCEVLASFAVGWK